MIPKTKELALNEIKPLIEEFKTNIRIYKHNDYKEAQLRIDFINPFLKALGWDVENAAGLPQYLRTVLQEESIDVEDGEVRRKKQPDYTLLIDGNRKLFVEAKKARINILESKSEAFQTRRYGWSANLNISILTNFETLVIYDTRYKPNGSDEASVARYKVFSIEDYVKRFDEIYDLLSFNSLIENSLEEILPVVKNDSISFDKYFLQQIENWRKNLGNDIFSQDLGLDEDNLNLTVQRLINRIIFLRICEDRNIEREELLKNIKSYDELKILFIESDKRYNSGIFNFIEDELANSLILNPTTLIDIFNNLYYPNSPYNFAVVDASILSQIYERYLGNRLFINSDNTIEIRNEPEVMLSNGVVPTPKLIVDLIVKGTLEPIVINKTHVELLDMKIADICCGSGTFLIGAYEYLLNIYTEAIINSDIQKDQLIYKKSNGLFGLTLRLKKEILIDNLFGVDINPYAVEVTQFSLLLKLLENESAGSIDSYIRQYGERALPNLENNIKCGNSLVNSSIYGFDRSIITNLSLLRSIKPFDWGEEFNFQGFDAIIGNPPYVRVQRLAKYFKSEVSYYQANFVTSNKGNYDKYFLFIEKAISLINDNGRLGFIIPNKFFITTAGENLRKHIAENISISKIIHFGETPVFPGFMTYTAILFLQKAEINRMLFQRIYKLSNIEIESPKVNIYYSTDTFKSEPWTFVSPGAQEVFDKLFSSKSVKLGSVADILVGLQTSKDEVYIIRNYKDKGDTIEFQAGGVTWAIEKEITQECLYKLEFGLFDTPEANARIIFPYYPGTSEVISEADMEEKYPLCLIYLMYFESLLLNRDIFKKKTGLPIWYQYGRSQNLTTFQNAEKIIWPVLSKGSPYAIDQNNLLFTGGGNGPYYALIPKLDYSIYYLLAVLSHPVLEAMVKSRASEFRGQYYSHGKQFISNLPIRVPNLNDERERELYEQVIKNTKELIDLKKSINHSKSTRDQELFLRSFIYLREELTSYLNDLFGITNFDLEQVKGENLFVVNSLDSD